MDYKAPPRQEPTTQGRMEMFVKFSLFVITTYSVCLHNVVKEEFIRCFHCLSFITILTLYVKCSDKDKKILKEIHQFYGFMLKK